MPKGWTNDKYRRESRKLADTIGATIDIERCEPDSDGKGGRMYYVTGPDDVYDLEAENWRIDPFDGNHYCYDWSEVYENLMIYATDLAYHYAGISPVMADALDVIAKDHPEFGSLLQAWLDDTEEDLRLLVMADWLEEHGKAPGLIKTLRGEWVGSERVK